MMFALFEYQVMPFRLCDSSVVDCCSLEEIPLLAGHICVSVKEKDTVNIST